MAGTLVGGSGNDGLNSSTSNDLKYNYADEVRGEIEIDKNNNIYVVSCTRSLNFPVSPLAFQPTHGGIRFRWNRIQNGQQINSINLVVLLGRKWR